MINSFYTKLAEVVVKYSVKINKDDKVFITGPSFATEFFQALFVEITKVGGHTLLLPQIEGMEELKYKYSSEEQLLYADPIRKKVLEDFDVYIVIHGDYNTRKLTTVDPNLIAKVQGSPNQREIYNILMSRLGTKELRYLVLPLPCNSLAQEANMDLISYYEFIEKALFLDKEDPINEWLEIKKRQNKLVEYLNEVDKIQVIGEDTDLTLSTKGRTWINCCGELNLPDGEIFASPIEDSVNGKIRFTYPGIYIGNEIENIYLEFKEGKVIKATASKGEHLLKELLKIENAEILGEFAIGTNYGITKFTKNMLFDEKMGGTLHCALGAGLEESGSKNNSAIHWDILKDMTQQGSKILADNKIIYEQGQWKI
ncbi:MAG: aminopeptidase [Promethearchaeota archaeon]|jgi:aminopeptidase